jgi:hypothetical protein
VLINQFAFPGLGTRLAGRRWGWAQMTLMLAGFILSMGFVGWYLVATARLLTTSNASEEAWRADLVRLGWIGWTGLALVIVAWCWAGLSSLAIWREASSQPPPFPTKLPRS